MTKKIKDDTPYELPSAPTMQSLQEELSFYKDLDGDYGMFYAFNKKKNELAKSINNYTIDITGSSDKGFSNFLTLSKELRSLIETTDWLKDKLGLSADDIKQEKSKVLPPLEMRLLKK